MARLFQLTIVRSCSHSQCIHVSLQRFAVGLAQHRYHVVFVVHVHHRRVELLNKWTAWGATVVEVQRRIWSSSRRRHHVHLQNVWLVITTRSLHPVLGHHVGSSSIAPVHVCHHQRLAGGIGLRTSRWGRAGRLSIVITFVLRPQGRATIRRGPSCVSHGRCDWLTTVDIAHLGMSQPPTAVPTQVTALFHKCIWIVTGVGRIIDDAQAAAAEWTSQCCTASTARWFVAKTGSSSIPDCWLDRWSRRPHHRMNPSHSRRDVRRRFACWCSPLVIAM